MRARGMRDRLGCTGKPTKRTPRREVSTKSWRSDPDSSSTAATSTDRGGSMLQNYPMYAYIPAKDMARARQFYERKVGLKPGREIAGGIGYKFGDPTARVMSHTPNAGTNAASQAFWQVDDVEREVADLKAKGVTFEDYD